MNAVQQWKLEFGPSYEIPAEVEAALIAAGFVDESWHNDVSPCFRKDRVANESRWECWIEHPDRKLREFSSMKRFTLALVTGWDSCETAKSLELLATESAEEMTAFISSGKHEAVQS